MRVREDEFLWTEKYRPDRIDDVVATQEIRAKFKAFVDQQNIPNLLLVGGPGTGKSTMAKAVCEELDCDYYFVNASKEGNIEKLRTDITDFSSTVSFKGGRKYVILDEADGLTSVTQGALRGFIEERSRNCGFIFTGNYTGKIIEPIRSRLETISFKPPAGQERSKLAMEFFGRVTKILDQEHVSYDKKTVVKVISDSFPDWRKILNKLQHMATGTGKIDASSETQFTDDLAILVGHLKAKNFTSARKWIAECNDMEGFYSSLFKSSETHCEGPADCAQLAFILAKYQHMAGTAIDPELNIAGCLAEVMVDVKFK